MSPVTMDLTLEDDDMVDLTEEDHEAKAVGNAIREFLSVQEELEEVKKRTHTKLLTIIQKGNSDKKLLFDGRKEVIKTIPHFWLRAFLNHPCICSIIHEDEKNCLYFLVNLEVEDFDDIDAGFRIHFYFRSNPYLRNDKLTKEFKFAAQDEELFSKSTEIKWKKGKNILKSLEQSRSEDNSGLLSTFFTWYKGNCNPSNDKVAQAIRNDIWPQALPYCVGIKNERDQSSEDQGELHSGNVEIMSDDDSGNVEIMSNDELM